LGKKLGRIATTRTLNGSGFVPWKTVSASPIIPARTSASGKILGADPTGAPAGEGGDEGEGKGAEAAWRSGATAAAWLRAMGGAAAATNALALAATPTSSAAPGVGNRNGARRTSRPH